MKRTERGHELKLERDIEKQRLVADIKRKAQICRKFITDKRHAEFKDLIETAIIYKRAEYETLADSVKDNDEMIRKSIVLCTEIKTLQWVLKTPEKFINAENKIIEQEKLQ